MKKVSLYVPCYNVEKFIQDCLESIFRQTYPIDEVLIINDGSIDRTVEVASRYPVKIIHHKENRGLAAARNTAFKEAKNEFVASLDADCIASSNWLEVIMKNFKDKDIVGVGGRVIEKYTVGIANRWRSVHMRQHLGNRTIVNPKFLYGSNTVYKASVIRALGLFDERYKTNYEDVDICKRIISRSYKLIYIPSAIVYHLRKDNLKSVLNTFWNWTFFEFPLSNKRNLFKKILNNIKVATLFSIKDFLRGDFSLLPIDFVLFFYHSFLIYQYYKNNSLQRRI